ncbi:MAG: tetratricopeptide repeat protein [Pirellulales bacterium]
MFRKSCGIGWEKVMDGHVSGRDAWRWRWCWVMGVWTLVSAHGLAQQPRRANSSVVASAPATRSAGSDRNAATISADLLRLYNSTQTMTEEKDFTALIDRLVLILQDQQRSAADIEYAGQLMAWSANKRGEWRCDRAGELVDEGKTAEAKKLDQQAMRDFQLALKYDPKRWKSRHNMAIILSMQGNHDGALAEFSEVIAQNPKYANAYFNRAEIYSLTSEYDLAVADYTSSLQLNPQDAEAYAGRARARFQLNEFDLAIRDFQKASQLAPDQIELQIDLADAYQSTGKWTEAMEAYGAALQRDDQCSRAFQNLGWLLATCPEAKIRSPRHAMQMVDKAVVLNGEVDYQLLDVKAAASAAAGDFPAAVQSAKRALEQAPEEEQDEIRQRLALYQKGRAYLQKNALNETSSPNAQTARSPRSSGSSIIGTGVR